MGLFLLSCSSNLPKGVKKVIKQAGDNAIELEKVIEHYSSSTKDSLKLKAAYFLIENMANKYSIVPVNENNNYEKLILNSNISEKKAWDPLESNVGKLIDSIKLKEFAYIKKVKDIDVITAEYLINNIDRAFEAWNKTKPFTNYSFDLFCEYILPYRIKNEPLTDWRSAALKKYEHLLDSLHDSFSLATEIVKRSEVYYNSGMSRYPFPITFEEIDNLRWGACNHLSNYLLFSLRALGIASAVDFVPVWANRSSGHVWNVIFDSSGKAIDVGFTRDGSNKIGYKISKIYRTTFSNNPNSIHKDWKDVTCEYKMPLTDVDINIFDDKVKNLFLFTFDNRKWLPVAFASKKNNKFLFKDMARGILFGDNKIFCYENEGKGIVYMLGVFLKEKKSFQMRYPIILKEDGTVHKLVPNFNKKREIKLYRKYPRYERIDNYARNMMGGIFELSDDKKKQEYNVIYTIKKKPNHSVERVNLSETFTGSYVKYTAPSNSWVNTSEIAFYYNNKKVDAIVIKPKNLEVKHIHDDNINTYYSGKKGESVIFYLGKNTAINSLLYAPRTDNNDIMKGELYELFFWNKEWVSLGRKKAKKYSLEFEDVPDNSLLLLRNFTKGVEERIFTYENGKQIWW